MLRNFELKLVWMLAFVCTASMGCSSLRLPDGDDFAAEKSRLVDMRHSNLESLVAETEKSENESADDLPGAEQSGVVSRLETGSTPEMRLPEVDGSHSGTSEIGHVNHAAMQPDRLALDQPGQTLEPLQNRVPSKDLSSATGQGISEKIIILKAKSTNPSNITEMIDKPANPASPLPEIVAVPDEVETPNPLTPIQPGAENHSIYSKFEPGRLVCGAGCDCDECQASNATVQVSTDSAQPDPSELLPSAATSLPSKAGVETVTADGTIDTESTESESNQFDPAQIDSSQPSATGLADSTGSPPETEIPEVATPAETGELITSEPVGMNIESASLSWDGQLKATIHAFEDQIIDLALTDYRRPKLQQSLAILQVLDDRLSSGRIALEQPKHRQYWQHQLTAILNMLQAARTNEQGGKQNVVTAVEHLKSAVIELQQLSGLSIARIEFCSGVSGYGQFVAMDLDQFRPDSKTLVYCEIENFSPVKETIGDREMFATRLECHLEILDQDNNVVQAVNFPVVEDVAINHRRDFYMHLPLALDRLPPASYQVRLEVKDLGSQKSARRSLPGLMTVTE